MTRATGALSFGFRTEALEAALLSLGRIALARLPVKYDFHKSLQPVESNGVQVATFQPNFTHIEHVSICFSTSWVEHG